LKTRGVYSLLKAETNKIEKFNMDIIFLTIGIGKSINDLNHFSSIRVEQYRKIE